MLPPSTKDPARMTATTNNRQKFIIQAVPEKGLGIIATEPIDEGEVIISEAPLFTQSGLRNERTIAASLAQNSADEKRQYLSLTNCHPTSRYRPLHGIYQTNALPCGENMPGFGAVATESGIFLQCSRFNSSCTPNVHNFWQEKDGVMVMRAMKRILPGEELCLCYAKEWHPRSVRQDTFRDRFGFTCTCVSCSLDVEASASSDLRRTQLGVLYHEIGNCARYPVLGVQKVKTALRLLREEGLVHSEDNFAYDAFQFCAACGNLRLAKAWAEKALNAARRTTGIGSDLMLKCSRYAQNPRAHPAWGSTRQPGGVVGLEGPDV